LDNAAKHGGDGKKICASMQLEGEQVVVRIRDFGPGIPVDELPLVKKKFYKGSSKVRGTGIGLAVCDDIVLMHGGTLTLENAAGGGTLVTIRLPISQ
jgi:signal transduction histidine kinase